MSTKFSHIKPIVMTAREEAKLNMYDAVITHANANPAIVATVPAFQAAMAAFSNIHSSLVSAIQLAESQIAGVTIDKSEARETLSSLTLTNAGAVFAYAASVNNNEMMEKARVTKSKLERLRDELVHPLAQEIHDLANANLAALAPYGVTAASLTLFQAAVDNYKESVAKPRTAVSQRVAYKETIKTLFSQGDELLKNQLDKIAVQFSLSNVEFYTAYKSNRVILDPGSSNTQVAGTVTNLSNGGPLAGVLVKNESGTEATTTDGAGEYELKIATPGIYNIFFSKDGFHSVEASVELTLGQTTTRNIAMNPL